MPNAIFRTSGLSDWIDAVSILAEDHNWEPVYWLDRPSMEAGVKDKFPDVTFHRTIDASRSIPPREYSEIPFLPSSLDTELLSDFLPYEKEALRMMDRQDRGNVNGKHFTYDERVRHFHRLLSFWEYLVAIERVDLVVFAEVPHMIYDYLLYAVCRENDVDTVMPMRTFLPGTNLVRETIHETPEYLHDPNADSEVSTSSERHIRTLRGEYDEAKPDFMHELSLEDYFSKLTEIHHYPRYLRWIGNQLKPHIGRKHMKEGDKLIEDSSVGVFQQYVYYLRARIYKRRLAQKYREMSEKPDLRKPFIYFALHYQPERATAPEGGYFVDQYLAVNLLAKHLPPDWSIYVKEHPHQFASHKKGEHGRRSYNYKDLTDIENVTLVDIDVPTFELIDRAEVVSTITGTAGWEAIVRGTPAILFGVRWYRDCHGCFFTPTEERLNDALDKITNGFTVNERSIREFINTVENNGHGFYLTRGEKPEHVGKRENAERIARAFSTWYSSYQEEKLTQ